MSATLVMSVLPLLSAISLTTQDAQSIIETMREKQAERWATVDNYTVVQSLLGTQTTMYFEKYMVGDQPAFRLVPMSEYAEQRGGQSAASSRQTAGAMADAFDMLGDSLAAQGMPGMDMGPMFSGMGTFLRGAEASEQPDGRGDAAKSMADMTMLAKRARLVGREAIDGRNAFVLQVDDLSDIDIEQPDDGSRFTLKMMSMWIDTEEYVPLKMKMDVEVTTGGKTTQMVIEKLDQDYRRVGPLFESHRQVTRMSGLGEVLDPKQLAELERAKAEMERMKAELEKMPAAQRRFVEGRMKSAMEQFDRMLGSSDGGVTLNEVMIDVVRIDVNQGPPSLESMANGIMNRGVPNEPSALARRTEASPTEHPLGPSRQDLDRFIGIYGVADQSGQPRNLFVTQSCDGHLVAGAMFGDASPWYFRSVGDTGFQMTSDFMNLRLDFELGADGTARAMRHDLDNTPSPLQRVGPLPEDSRECV